VTANRTRDWLISLGLAVITATVYWPVHGFDFVAFDDDAYIYQNPHVARGLTMSNVRWAFTTFDVANYHPLTWLSYLLDSSLFGMRPGPFHVENVILHILATLILFRVLTVATKGEIWPSAFVAAVFALHPTHVESVAWVGERKDVLSITLMLLATLAYLRFHRAKTSGLPRWGAYVLMLLAFTAALLAKPMVVTYPFLLLLFDYWPLQRTDWRRAVLEKLPLLVLSACASILTYVAQHGAGVVATLEHEPLLDRIANAAVSYVRYLGKIVWPADLAAFYPLQPSWPAGVVIGSVALLLIITIGCAVQARRRPYLAVGWLWFLGTMVPVIGLVQVGNQSIADRYLYLPLIGPAIMLAWLGRELSISRPWSRQIVPIAAAVSVLAGAIVAHHQVGVWRDTRTLFEHALFVVNGNAEAHVKLGVLDAQHGDTAAAAQHYEAAIAADPRYYVAEFDYGNLLLEDHPELAIGHYRRAAILAPGVAAIHNNWGFALLRLNHPGEAFDRYTKAAQLDPYSFDAHYNLGQLLLAAGRKEQASAEFSGALRIDPQNARARRGYAAATAP
jgi:hypothetical protein